MVDHRGVASLCVQVEDVVGPPNGSLGVGLGELIRPDIVHTPPP